MKKKFLFVLCLMMLTACGSKGEEADAAAVSENIETVNAEDTEIQTVSATEEIIQTVDTVDEEPKEIDEVEEIEETDNVEEATETEETTAGEDIVYTIDDYKNSVTTIDAENSEESISYYGENLKLCYDLSDIKSAPLGYDNVSDVINIRSWIWNTRDKKYEMTEGTLTFVKEEDLTENGLYMGTSVSLTHEFYADSPEELVFETGLTGLHPGCTITNVDELREVMKTSKYADFYEENYFVSFTDEKYYDFTPVYISPYIEDGYACIKQSESGAIYRLAKDESNRIYVMSDDIADIKMQMCIVDIDDEGEITLPLCLIETDSPYMVCYFKTECVDNANNYFGYTVDEGQYIGKVYNNIIS